jgi:hypothetical protein
LLVLAALLSLPFNQASAATGATDIDAIYHSWPGTANDTHSFYLTFNTDLATPNSVPVIKLGAGWSSTSPANTGDVFITGSDVWTGTQGPASISGADWNNNGNATRSKPRPYAFGVPSKSTIEGVPTNHGLSDAVIRRELMPFNGQTPCCINPPTD